MTSLCISPSRFHGLPWESWTNSLGRTSPIEDKPPEVKQPDKNKAGVMKLPQEDMKIFGMCPERDPLSVILCGRCNMYIKPQALIHHFETRHVNKDIVPSQPLVIELRLQEKTMAKVKNPPAKVKTKKLLSKETGKSKEGVVNSTPSLPVSLTLETPVPEAAKGGESVEPVAAAVIAPVVGKVAAPASPVPSKRRPPRKHAPIKEREYDPDKHCGVLTAETMKPCTWSLTCKSHPMSLRRAVTGRSKPFDQLLADHRQAKEALLKQKKNLELQNSSVMLTPPSSQSNSSSEQKSVTSTSSSEKVWPVTAPATAGTTVTVSPAVDSVARILLRLPELSLDVTSPHRVYLSASPQSLVVKPSPPPPQPPPSLPHLDLVPFTLNHPKALNVSAFSNHKIGGLVYTSRRMQIARQGMESCLHRAGNGIYASAHGRELYSAPTLNYVLNNMASRGNKRPKPDKSNKPNKKICISKEEATSLLNFQIKNLKSVLSRQYTTTTSRSTVPSSTNSQFHIPNILSNALKRSADTPSKQKNKKLKKNNSAIVGSVLSSHSKNGLGGNKPSVPYVRVAIANGKVDSDSKTPKFANSNKILNETDLRKIGLRFEIFE